MSITPISGTAAEILHNALRARIRRNPAYSLRALARDLGVSHAYLSQVLRRKKPLAIARAGHIAKVLGFGPDEAQRLVEAALSESRSVRGTAASLAKLAGASAISLSVKPESLATAEALVAEFREKLTGLLSGELSVRLQPHVPPPPAPTPLSGASAG